MSHDETGNADPETSLRQSWSIGPLRPWLLMIAEREMPDDLRGRVEASDLVQQTLLDAWQGDRGFRGSNHAQRLAWLRVILRRVMLQNCRRVGAQKRGGGAERTLADAIARSSLRVEQLAACDEPSPDEVVDNAEQNLLVADALLRLPEDYRKVIELRQFENRSHEEIARQLGRSPAATRMLWVRALIQLRAEMNVDS